MSAVYAASDQGKFGLVIVTHHDAALGREVDTDHLLLQAATSFECDGCAHHASYHSMENPQEDAIILKWKNQEAALVLSHDRQDRSEVASSRSGSKRKRITDLTNDG